MATAKKLSHSQEQGGRGVGGWLRSPRRGRARGDTGLQLGSSREICNVVPDRIVPAGCPGVFLELEPHLKGGGQFGGVSGVDGFGVALRALLNLLDYVGIGYTMTEYDDIAAQKS